jgi:5-methyltetrahydropteroyltriglutamate--homocysteine methyltransferase
MRGLRSTGARGCGGKVHDGDNGRLLVHAIFGLASPVSNLPAAGLFLEINVFQTTIAGSLPKPAWLSETQKLWPQWKAQGAELQQAKADATLLWIKQQEDAGLDIVGDGEQSRQHFVHGFLEQVQGIDFEHKVTMGIRNGRYDAEVPQVIAPLRLKGRVHAFEAQLARGHTKKKLKFTLPGPLTIVDTVADRFYGNKVEMAMAFAELLNQEALALQADGVDIIQFDEPAFNVYLQDAADWGVKALERAVRGLSCTTAVHICYGYGIKANLDWKETLGREWRQYEAIFPALAKSSIQQVSLECYHSHVPPHLMALLEGKDVMVGVIDVASDEVETPEQVADTIGLVLEFVPKNRLIACTNCGMAPMNREIAVKKLEALAAGAALARRRYGNTEASR